MLPGQRGHPFQLATSHTFGWDPIDFFCNAILLVNGRTISRILEFGPFIIMSRLTFMTYLVQGPVIWTRYGSIKERKNILQSLQHAVRIHRKYRPITVRCFCRPSFGRAPFANLERLLFPTLNSFIQRLF
ncbi:hypothetical protein CEXT_813121 [Caerostris extrusa]|uniref:Uncharacterized protein n=1 Tax=Caerostris extrusa TaxID=172846 RepID=A0AAV4R046_CAEEX|nr:hypothetical protein CEXT_813121 [Caerostris extrusa]